MLARVLPLTSPFDVRRTLSGVGRRPVTMVGTAGVWRATHTPRGAATILVDQIGAGVRVRAWGDGAEWVCAHAPELVGLGDTTAAEFFEGLARRHPVVADLARRLPGLRVPRTQAVVEALTTAVLEQKVVGADARASYRRLVHRYGSDAPGPGARLGLRLPPPAGVLARIPSHAFRPLGVEAKRADTVKRVAANASRLEEVAGLPLGEGYRRMRAVPGIGPWTAAEAAAVALGDPDAVSVGDFHLPNLVCWALAGEPRGDDARMLELLEPFRGHRARVIGLLEGAGRSAPRYGPRMPRARALV